MLRNHWSPGDIVMLTAAVRDLHRHHPGRFLTDVRTSCPALWEHNPHLVALDETDPSVEVIECGYPLIDQSNARPLHCLHGFGEFLARKLGVRWTLTEPRGDLHLSPEEKTGPGLVERLLGRPVPYWLVVAGGKHDYTIKWWDPARYQAVVDHFRDRLLFVQVGDTAHHHPRLTGVLDLRGRTDLRGLVTLVHHATGALCPVTSVMHLAAAVECPAGRLPNRPCIVVAGGREPPTWEAYPGHQFVHTVGALPCCARGGCWRARTLPLHDGDAERDAPRRLCLDVVNGLPRCMDLISAADIIRRIELHLADGSARPLLPIEARSARPALTRARRSTRPKTRPRGTARVTICLMASPGLGGDWRRCLASVRRHCPRSAYQLRMIAAGLPDATQHRLLRLQREGLIDQLQLAPAALDRTTLVHRLLRDRVATEFVWFLDPTARVSGRDALPRRLAAARRAPPATVVWNEPGPGFAPASDPEPGDLENRVRRAPWYRGRLRGSHGPDSADRRILFNAGDWFARSAALRSIGWPDPGLPGDLHDRLLVEAIREQGWRIGRLGKPRGAGSNRRQEAQARRGGPRNRDA